eukprot:409091-Prymnesium_polylepis.1
MGPRLNVVAYLQDRPDRRLEKHPGGLILSVHSLSILINFLRLVTSEMGDHERSRDITGDNGSSNEVF